MELPWTRFAVGHPVVSDEEAFAELLAQKTGQLHRQVRATGLDKTGEQTPSSRRLAKARRAIAFEWVRVLYSIGNRNRAHIGPFFYLVQQGNPNSNRFCC